MLKTAKIVSMNSISHERIGTQMLKDFHWYLCPSLTKKKKKSHTTVWVCFSFNP